ncbi:MAG: hypothetical protein KAT71_08230 [Gammaproteobacteria bacterium]|nr:hypothetical protein [Gammaproteobacteria bacterium]
MYIELIIIVVIVGGMALHFWWDMRPTWELARLNKILEYFNETEDVDGTLVKLEAERWRWHADKVKMHMEMMVFIIKNKK